MHTAPSWRRVFEKEMAHFGHFDEFEAYVRTGTDTWDYPTVRNLLHPSGSGPAGHRAQLGLGVPPDHSFHRYQQGAGKPRASLGAIDPNVSDKRMVPEHRDFKRGHQRLNYRTYAVEVSR